MSGIADALWSDFAAETLEHLDLIEPILVEAETAPVDPAAVATLFRSFHSVKGLARAMDLRAMEGLAHHAESLLGRVRDGNLALEGGTVGLLLEGVDALRAMRESALQTRSDPPAAGALIRRLEAAYTAGPTGGGPPPPAGGEAPAAGPPPAAEPPPIPLHDDPELVRYFVELLEPGLPVIARLAQPEPPDEPALAEIRDQLDTLRHAAEVMEFDNLVDLFDELAGLAAGTPDGTARSMVMRILGRLKQAVDALEESTRMDAGGRSLSEILGGSIEREVGALVADFEALLPRFLAPAEQAHAESDQGLAAEAEHLARDLYSYLLFAEAGSRGQLSLMLEDAYGRAASGELFVFPELIEVTRRALVLLRPPLDRAPGEEAQALAGELRHVLLTGADGAAMRHPLELGREALAGFDIAPELREILTPENIEELMDAVRAGKERLYEITAYLEGQPADSQAFLAWLQGAGQVITNRTVLAGGQPWFEFLVASAEPPEAVEAALRALDGGGDWTRWKACRGRGTGAPRQPAAEAEPAGRRQAGPPERARAMIRVAAQTIDEFMTHIGEMVTISGSLALATQDPAAGAAFNALRKASQARGSGAAVHHESLDAVASAVKTLDEHRAQIARAAQQLSSTLSRLQDSALDLRVVPIDLVLNRLPRVVRDIAQSLDKQVRLEIAGREVRIDKGMVELLVDPLLHMARNAVDHGIEPPAEREAAGKPAAGRILVSAERRGNQVAVEIQDDGKGLDPERIRARALEKGLIGEDEAQRLSRDQLLQLVFAPGFSTAARVTETSGRGVGMDVVQTTVARLGGSIQIRSDPGQGSTFTLLLPLSVAIQEALLVEVGGQLMAIPDRLLGEIIEVEAGAVQTLRGQPAILLRDQLLPLFTLAELLGRPRTGARPAYLNVAVLARGRRRIGVAVDRLLRRHELFVREVHPWVAAIPGVEGAATLGDGRVILILDGEALFRLAEAVPATAADRGPPCAV